MDIEWKSICNFSRYKVSKNGDVYDFKLKREVPMNKTKDGYLSLTLRSDSGERKTFKVHRLVSIAFIPNNENKETVNHIDGVKENNNVCNLEWATRSENTQHAWDNNLIKDLDTRKRKIREKQGKPVICITTGEKFNSIGKAAEIKKLKKSNISAVCLNKIGYKSAGKSDSGEKLIWRFLKDENK
jgi:hypothetical protein